MLVVFKGGEQSVGGGGLDRWFFDGDADGTGTVLLWGEF